MASFNMNFTVPDNKLNEFIEAVRDRYARGHIGPDGQPVDPASYTPAELQEMVRKDFEVQLRVLYNQYIKKKAASQADGSIDITA